MTKKKAKPEEPVEEEDVEEADPEDGLEPPEPDPATPDAKDKQPESIDTLLEKTRAVEPTDPLGLFRDEPKEPTTAEVVPKQSDEFICKKCFMVRHASQLANKTKQLCRDCA